MGKKKKKLKHSKVDPRLMAAMEFAEDLGDVFDMMRAQVREKEEPRPPVVRTEIVLKVPLDNDDEYIDDLDKRDMTEDDIFEMMTDDEVSAYDFLDTIVLSNDDAGIPSDEDSGECFDTEDFEIMVDAVMMFKGAVAEFIYANNAGFSYDSLVMMNADYKLTESLEWMVIIAQKYRYVETLWREENRIKKLSEAGKQVNCELNALIERVEWLNNSLEGIDDSIREHLDTYYGDDDE